MATILLEGFDKYGPTGENSPSISTLMGQEYLFVASSATASIVAGLSRTGYAYSIPASGNGTIGLFKDLPSTYSRLIGGLRFNATYVGNGAALVQFRTITNVTMCSIVINGVGVLSLRTGADNSVSIIGNSSTFIPQNSTHYLEWDITFGASSNYQLWLDGVSVLSGSTGNTGNGNSSAGVFFLGNDGNNLNTWGSVIFDDVYLFDTTGSFNNAVLNTNPRIETSYPSSDSQTQWTNAGNLLLPVGITQTGVSNVTSTTSAPGANQLVLLKITPGVTCTLQSIAILPAATSATAKFKSVLYTDSAGAPNLLTATGTEVVGATSGTTLTLPFGAGQALTGGTSYWIGYITDTSLALSQYDSTTNKGQRAANTYGSGAPGTAPAMTTLQPTWQLWGNATGAATNWASVAQNPMSGFGPAADNGAITSSTSGNEDLYGFPALSTSPAHVYSVGVKAMMKKSDTGARTIDLRVKSSATTISGNTTGQGIAQSYTWLNSYFDSDPNGNIAWTGTSVNAATSGPKVAS